MQDSFKNTVYFIITRQYKVVFTLLDAIFVNEQISVFMGFNPKIKEK